MTMLLSRRRMLRGLGFGLAAFPICLGAAGALAAGTAPHWSYEGADGPANWGALSANSNVRELGTRQMSVDLRDAEHVKHADIAP